MRIQGISCKIADAKAKIQELKQQIHDLTNLEATIEEIIEDSGSAIAASRNEIMETAMDDVGKLLEATGLYDTDEFDMNCELCQEIDNAAIEY